MLPFFDPCHQKPCSLGTEGIEGNGQGGEERKVSAGAAVPEGQKGQILGDLILEVPGCLIKLRGFRLAEEYSRREQSVRDPAYGKAFGIGKDQLLPEGELFVKQPFPVALEKFPGQGIVSGHTGNGGVTFFTRSPVAVSPIFSKSI